MQHDGAPSSEVARFLWRCGHGALTAVQQHALTAAGERLTPAEWEQAAQLAQPHRLGPLVFKHAAEAGLLPVMPGTVVDALKAAYCSALVVNRTLQIELGRILAALAARQLDAIPLKGVSLAVRYYPELALRPASDIDLLVKPSQVAASIRALRALGYVPYKGSEALTGKHALRFLEHRLSKPNGPLLELHTTLARAPSYRRSLSLPVAWSRSSVRVIGGQPVRCLATQDEIHYLCLHFAAQHDSTRWFWLVDIAQIVDALPAEWNWNGFVDQTTRLGLATPVATTIQDATDKLALRVPHGVLDRLWAASTSPRERAAWTLARAEFAAAGRVSRHLLMLHGLRAKLSFMSEVARAGPQVVIRRLTITPR